MDYVGIDGLLLRHLLRSQIPRTSADVLLPVFLSTVAIRSLVLIGGAPGRAAAKVPAVRSLCFDPSVQINAYDGYGELDRLMADQWESTVLSADVVVLGLGAPKQDQIAAALGRVKKQGLVFTCGGWIDQVGEAYYPPWAYRYRLNWLVRLLREPSRLLRRYTLDALWAVWQRHALRAELLALPGLVRYAESFQASDGRGR